MAVVDHVLYLALVSAVVAQQGTCVIRVDLATRGCLLVVTCLVVQVDVAMAIAVVPIVAHVTITGLAPHATLLYVTLHVKMAEHAPQLIAPIVTFAFALLTLEELTVASRIALLHALILEVDVL